MYTITGLSRSTINMILATAMLTETSVWAVTQVAFSGLKWRRRRQSDIFAQMAAYRKLPSASAKAVAADHRERFAPSYFAEAMRLPPAKFAHVSMVMQPMLCRSTVANRDDPVYVNPYADDVVRESCLATPVYIHCREGQPRWLPRKAFSGVVPSPLLENMTKGNPGGFFHAVADDHLPILRERLFGGELVKRMILDRKNLQDALGGHSLRGDAAEILDACSLEAFLGECSTKRRMGNGAA